MAHSPVNTILDKACNWQGATSGEFDPGSVFCGLFGKEPMPHVARAGCLAAFGSPTPHALRIWKWTDYVLDTALPGFYIEVRLDTPDGHGRRFGYVIEPGLEGRMRQERRELWTQTGRWPENHEMDSGTACRTAHDAMVEALQAVGRTCGCRCPDEDDDDVSRTVTLWRPVGPAELQLIREGGMRGFPPRLPDQPIFYPVTTQDYAAKIARDWNVPASGSGFVTRFEVLKSFLDAYPVRRAGGGMHLKHWIPAEQMDSFNAAIVGCIEVTASFGQAPVGMAVLQPPPPP